MAATLNPLLARVKFPGKVFQLPSRGLFYAPGVLADTVNDGEIQVRPMSALLELKIRTADLLLSGKIISQICEECAPEILKPLELLSKDVDALFLFLLAVTYGDEKEIKALHECEKYLPNNPNRPTKKLSDGQTIFAYPEYRGYVVSLPGIISSPNNSALNHRQILYTCKLPNEQVVNLRPTRFADDLVLMNILTQIAKSERDGQPASAVDIENKTVTDMLSVIESVESDGNTITDRKQIEEWIRTIPSTYHKQIVETSNKANEWGFDYEVTLTCKDCGQPFKYSLEVNPVNFFTG